MKKMICILIGFAAVLTARADLLYWLVDEADVTDFTDYTYAAISVDDGAAHLYYADGEGTVYSGDSDWRVDRESFEGGYPVYAYLGDYGSGEHSFLIELYNDADERIGVGTAAMLSTLGGSIARVEDIAVKSAPEPWKGGLYSVPEPTSGVLMLFGLAGLALRRRMMRA